MLGLEVYSRHLFEFMLSTDHHEALGHG